MAKLKIKIKNSQLAEALNKVKKPEKAVSPNPVKAKSPPSQQENISSPAVSSISGADAPSSLQKKSEAPPVEKQPSPLIEEPKSFPQKESMQKTTTPPLENIPSKTPSEHISSTSSQSKPFFRPKTQGSEPSHRSSFNRQDHYNPRQSNPSSNPSQGPRFVFKPKQPGQPSNQPGSNNSTRSTGLSGFRPHSNQPRPKGSGGSYQYRPADSGSGSTFRSSGYKTGSGGHFRASTGGYSPSGNPGGFRSGPPRSNSGLGSGGRFSSFPNTNRFPSSDQKALPRSPPKSSPRTKQEEEESARKSTFKDAKDKVQKKPDSYRSFDSRDKQGLRSDEESENWRSHRKNRKMRNDLNQEDTVRPKNLAIRVPITIKDLAAEMKLKASQLISNLFMKGVVLTLNDYIDDETTIQLLGQDFDCEITLDTTAEKRIQITDKTISQEISETDPQQLQLRRSVVAFMGNVDAGKTSLIDKIRKTNVVATEAGAITQHIGAFTCHTAMGDITILDTPGHEAFSAMRTRGIHVTDIIVLVVAGDEGIKSQTLDAIQQAQTANVPIVVAINKSDKPNFDAENVYRQLSEINLLPEAWGGQTITTNCSATTGQGIQELLELLALQAEVLELKANPNTRARGAVIESEMHKGLGAVTTVLVQNGTLNLKDAIVFAEHWGRVKTMHNEFDQPLQNAGPSTPVKITGLSGLPKAGSEFIVVKDEKEAIAISAERSQNRKHLASQIKTVSLENILQKQLHKQDKKALNLMLRADVQGSLEALKHSLQKIVSSKVDINIVSAEVGEISESDISLAAAAKTTIIGFHTQIESHAESLIKELKVKVKLFDVIYHAVDEVKEMMVSLLDKIVQEHDIGEVQIKAIFKSSQLGNIAGCQVSDGIVKRSSHVRLVRDKQVVWKGSIGSLKKGKEDVREMSKGQECGILLQNFNDYKEGDLLQVYDVTYLTPEL